MNKLQPALDRLARGKKPRIAVLEAAFETILDGEATPAQIGAFLMGLHRSGETVKDISIGAQVMRRYAVAVRAPSDAIDTCGTGGDSSGTYNISTAVAIVLAACGVPVAKHGNRALTSKSGSAEVLEALGVRLDLPPHAIEQCIKETGIGFMFAVNHHKAMRHVAAPRKELGFRTIFNLLGPLSNPAGVKRQLLGVFAPEWVEPFAQVLKKLGTEKAWVVHGDGLDELTTTGSSRVAILEGGTISLREVTPEEAGLPRAHPADLVGGDVAHNAAAITALFSDDRASASLPYRDIVLLNAAAGLCVADRADTLKEGVEIAASAIDDGSARDALAHLVRVSNS